VEGYKILVGKHAERGLDRIRDNIVLRRLVRKIDELAKNPRPAGVRKIVGSEIDFRIRVGDYRIIYQVNVDEKIIEIRGVGHWKNIYRKL
jgi:mRNA interferase RelE/StbE